MSVEESQLEAAKKMVLSKILDKAASERLGRIRAANPMLATQVESYLIQVFQMGKLNGTLTDEKLKEILNFLAEKRDTKIIRK